MGGKPSPPETPNPYKVAAAQGAADVRTAVAQAQLNNIDQYTPFGSVTYRKDGATTMRLGDGRTIQVPKYVSNQVLSTDQKTLLDLQERAGRQTGTLANEQLSRLNTLLGKPIDVRGLPDAPTSVPNAPTLQKLTNFDPNLTGTIPQGAVRNSYDAGGDIQTSIGPTDYSADRANVENAMLARLNPQIDRDRAALQTRLANQGVTAGSDAYNNAIDELNRQVTDQRMQTVLAGGQEQSRLAQLAALSGGFANSAQAQQNQQNQALADFYNQAQNQLFGQDSQQAAFGNQTAQQEAQNQMTQLGFNNDIASQNYNLDLNQAQNQQALREKAFQELIAFRNQPISETSALMSGTQPTIPQFQPWNAPNLPQQPIASSVYNSAALANQQYASQMQGYSAGMGGMYGLGSTLLGGMFKLSDRKLKKNIKRVGKLDNGLPIYVYEFIGETKPQIGLMADEVEKVHPDAVKQFGKVKYVNYALAVEPVGA